MALYDVDGAATSQHGLATEAGLGILREGGSAFDAAAAMQFVLNVVQPHSNGIGGGATILAHVAGEGDFALDARETAPAVATADQFVGLPAEPAETSGLAVGVPGTVRALELLVERWGTMPFARTLDDAIRIAEGGFPVGRLLAAATADVRTTYQPETAAFFPAPGRHPAPAGRLARTARSRADVSHPRRARAGRLLQRGDRRGAPRGAAPVADHDRGRRARP